MKPIENFFEVLAFILVFMLYYFIFSLIGCLFISSYIEIISNGGWFILYSITLGWWLTALTFDIDISIT